MNETTTAPAHPSALSGNAAAFWGAMLADAPGLLALPFDRARPARQSGQTGQCQFTLDARLTAQLRELAARHGTGLAAALTAAWSAWLARMSGQTDLVIGYAATPGPTPLAPLRLQLDDNAGTAALLARVHGLLGQASAQPAPALDQLAELLAAPRSASHHRLFQAAIVYAADAAPGAHAATLLGTALDLGLCCTVHADAIAVQLVYAHDLVDAGTAQRWASLFQTLLASMLADDQLALGRLALLTAHDRAQLLRAAPDAAPPAGLIQQHVEARVRARPDALAIVDADGAVTYAQLNRRANRLAHRLIALGAGPDRPVAVCAERGAALIIALLGILKAGAAYVPLDPGHPPERLAYMLADCQPAALLAQASVQGRLPAHAVPVIGLDADAAPGAGWPSSNPDPQRLGVQPSHLAYIIYTSGSTGEPKGVMVEHRNVLSLVFSGSDAHAAIDANDCLVHCANPAFDAATWEIWGALLNGARLLVVAPAVLLDAAALERTLTSHGATILHLTAGIFNQHADALAHLFPTLKSLLFGGDQADPGKVMQVVRHSPPGRLIHCYGPTETTTFATTFVVEAADAASGLPIGKALAHRRVYVLDPYLAPVPVGVAGEIYIGGAGVARGYLNRAALSAEHFIDDPFAQAPQARMYKTGDVGRWRADGNLDFLGRNDTQVKIRGFRVELGDIEARLAAHPQVRDALVLARDGAQGERQLVAYLTEAAPAPLAAVDFDWSDMLGRALGEHAPAAPAPALTPTVLQSFMGAGLPDYMVPAAYVTLAALPLTANGKLDRKALPAPAIGHYASRPYEAPHGPVETTIARLWGDLLVLSRIGRDDNFFALGGHSILAVQLAARLARCFGADVTLGDIGAQPTLRDLAALIGTLA